MPANSDLAWFVVRLIDLTAAADAVAAPPPGQNMISTNVRCVPFWAGSTVPVVWKSFASCAEIGFSLNQIATLCWLLESAAAQLLAAYLNPAMTPVAVHVFCAEVPDAKAHSSMAMPKQQALLAGTKMRSEAGYMTCLLGEHSPARRDLKLVAWLWLLVDGSIGMVGSRS